MKINNTFYIITTHEINEPEIPCFSHYILAFRHNIIKARFYAKSDEGEYIPHIYRVKKNSENSLAILSNIKISFKRGKKNEWYNYENLKKGMYYIRR